VRYHRGMQLAGTGTTDPRWLAKIIAHPPTSLSTLEYWIGTLDVDFAGGEGNGSLYRPCETPRGALRAGVLRMSARFRYDMYHERAREPRDMTLAALSLVLDVPHAAVARLLEARHGAGRAFTSKHGPIAEYGQWFYLSTANDGAPILEHEVTRPEWAIPAAPTGALEDLLHLLHDRLICDSELAPMHAALEPVAEAAGVELHLRAGRIDLSFRPAITLDSVLTELRWENPVSSSGDVHLSRWSVYPHRPDLAWSAPHINDWHVDVSLDGWPKGADGDLPQLGRAGASPLYDARACTTKVGAITIQKRR
jgi:hypothetical protein